MSAVIRASALSKDYRRFAPGHRLRTLKSLFVRGPSPARRQEMVRALREVSFEVQPGEMFSVIGGNGSGKSTLLKLISGILRPTSGSLEVDGRVTALIELGAGFHPEISGRENVFIAASVLGLSRREIERRYDRIVEFSGLGDFLEEPVKNYSSGMYVRLGFAVAIHTDPEVLLVDEVLAVGDEAFAHRCIGKIQELLAAGRTVVFVSHALGMVEDLSTRVMWLDRGVARAIGEPRQIVDAYRQSVAELEGEGHRARKASSDSAAAGGGDTDRWGSGAAEITAVRLTGADGVERYHYVTGEPVHFEIEVVAREPLDDFVFGVALTTPRGIEVWGINSDLSGVRAERFDGEATVRLVCPELRLAPGEYRVDVAVHSKDGAPYDYRRRLLAFSMTSESRGVGVYFPAHRWEFDGAIRTGNEELR